jgi:hypothetical protein
MGHRHQRSPRRLRAVSFVRCFAATGAPLALPDFRPIEASATTAMMRDAFARRVENALACFGVFGKGR